MKKRTAYIGAMIIVLMLMTPLAIAGNTTEESSEPIIWDNILGESSAVNPIDSNNTTDELIVPDTGEDQSSFFTISLSDTQILAYSPLSISEKIQNGTIKGETIIEQLNDLYNPGIQIKLTETIDYTWVLVNEESGLAMGDILVSEDFSRVGICLKKDQVYSITDQTTMLTSAFTYYNQALHTKNLTVVYGQDITDDSVVTENKSPEGTVVLPTDIVPVNPSQTINGPLILQMSAIPIEPQGPYFTLVFDDKDFRSYSPLQVYEQIQNSSIPGQNIIEKLKALYYQGIEVAAAQTIDNNWQIIGEETRFILGDILVSENFSKIGIWIGKDEVYCLTDQTIQLPAEFTYYNLAFQSKTIQEVW